MYRVHKYQGSVCVRELIDYLLFSNILCLFLFSTKDDTDFGALAAEIEGAGAAKEQEPQKSKGKKKKEKKKQDFEYVLKSIHFFISWVLESSNDSSASRCILLLF